MAKRNLSQKPSDWKVPLILLVVLLILAGGVVLQKQLSSSQDLRSAASVANGIVEVSAVKMSNPALKKTFKVSFNVNTHAAQVDGIQLVFTVSGPDMSNLALSFGNSQLKPLVQNIEQVSTNSYKITALVVPQTLGSPFANNTSTSFMTLSLIPNSYGDISIDYDNDLSSVTLFNSDPLQDQLKMLNTTTFSFSQRGKRK